MPCETRPRKKGPIFIIANDVWQMWSPSRNDLYYVNRYVKSETVKRTTCCDEALSCNKVHKWRACMGNVNEELHSSSRHIFSFDCMHTA